MIARMMGPVAALAFALASLCMAEDVSTSSTPSVPAEGASRAIGVVPLAQSQPEAFSTQRAQSYGVFVGIDQFPEDSSIVALKYAAADARSMRDCFVNDLGYVPAENTRLLATGAEGADRPTKSNILKAIKFAADSAGPQGCVIVDLSTHGIEGYVLAEDSQRAILEDSAIPLKRVEDYLKASKCPRRMLFFDACREKVASDGERALSGGMSEEFANAFGAVEGFAVLKSCDKGQYSYEMPEQGHGAFTYFLLEGLRGGAPANADGLITASSLSSWVKQRVEDWSRNKPGGKQSPRCDLREATGDLPLAVSRAFLEQASQKRAEIVEATMKISEMFKEGKLNAEQYALAAAGLVSKDEKKLQAALDLADGRLRPEFAEPLLKAEPTPAPVTPPPITPPPPPVTPPSLTPPPNFDYAQTSPGVFTSSAYDSAIHTSPIGPAPGPEGQEGQQGSVIITLTPPMPPEKGGSPPISQTPQIISLVPPMPPEKGESTLPIPNFPGFDPLCEEAIRKTAEFYENSARGDVKAELQLYSDPMENYFGEKNRSRASIEKEQQIYYARYASRSIQLLGTTAQALPGGKRVEVLVDYEYNFVKKDGQRQQGVSHNRIIWEKRADGMKIVSHEEVVEKKQ
ncbi:MAG: caspase family protein [Candidatus Sumerlaeota bacterium]|nr:caspase family protein [Candidatus Sumerlaeota bacterium]